MNTLILEQLFNSAIDTDHLYELLRSLTISPASFSCAETNRLLNHESISGLITAARASSSISKTLQVQLVEYGRKVMDCSGTGGSGMPHFNTSTSSAFVMAAAGLKVAKFGGRAASSKSGSFDFLEGLGFSTAIPHESIVDVLENCGLAFILAAGVYPQLMKLAPLRKKLGRPTVLNYIGPLLNPLCPSYRLMGISSDPIRVLLAELLSKSADDSEVLLVTGNGRMDEFDPFGINRVSSIKNGVLSELELSFASELGNLKSGFDESKVLDANENVRIFGGIVDGEDSRSIFYQTLVLNSAAGLMVGGVAESIADGISMAKKLIASGAVAAKLEQCRRNYARFS